MTIRYTWLRRAASLLLLGIYPGCNGLPFALPTNVTGAPRAAEKERQSVDPLAQASSSKPQGNPKPEGHDTNTAADACLATAREMEAHADHLAAIEQYERARHLDPHRTGIRSRLAVLYDHQGNLERAAAEYAAALKEEPKNADLWNDFAYFQFQCGEFEKAESSARKAIKLEPEHKRSWVSLGVILAEQARYDEALEAFTHAVNPATAHNNLGIILAGQGRIEDARRELAEAQRLDPTLRQPPSVLQQLSDEFVRATQPETASPGETESPSTPVRAKQGAAALASTAPRTATQKSAPIFINDSGAEDDLHSHTATRSPTRNKSRDIRR